jgi:hypothetical protein
MEQKIGKTSIKNNHKKKPIIINIPIVVEFKPPYHYQIFNYATIIPPLCNHLIIKAINMDIL